MTEVDVRPGMSGLPASRLTPDPPKKRIFEELETTSQPSSTPAVPSNVDSVVDSHSSSNHDPSPVNAGPVPADAIPQASNDMTTGETPSTPQERPANPNKKRKLSPASKEAKEKQKAEEKAKKEAERKAKEEEKRKRDEEKEEERKLKEKEKKKREEEREEKRRQKEEEKQAKEDEKRKKEEEKQRKERSQMKLNAFFTKPKAAPITTTGNEANSARTTTNLAPDLANKASKPASDFELEFPPFFIQSHVKLAPNHRFERDSSALSHACEKLDSLRKSDFGLANDDIPLQQYNPAELFQMISYRRRQGEPATPSVKEILLKLQDPELNSIDLTDTNGTATQVEKLLRKIPMKVLNFREDVRPPYQGTFTKRLERRAARKLCRNPFWRGVPEFNYDYDSEAEWEEPEEGEDILSEGDDEVSDDGEDDMDDFLDDGEDESANTKRRMIVGDLEPKCTGICWAENSADNPIINQHRMEIIPENITFPIDPFSTQYWETKPKVSPGNSAFKVPHRPSTGKAPLSKSQQQSLLSPSSATKSSKHLTPMVVVPVSKPKPRIQFPEDKLDEFKEAVSGSNLTKAGLIEVLKKRFPKVSKDIIKETLTILAARQGQKEVDKKWVLL
ncbi:hypothetical protein H101_06742 [Trichophyton interdigitale H6]|nr:hypothetical protein H101_06742 [Trichophyton interdigitale H6]